MVLTPLATTGNCAIVIASVPDITRVKTAGDAGDITALRDVEARIETELSRLEKMEKHSDSIRKNVDGSAAVLGRHA